MSDLVDGLVALMNSNYSMPCNIGNPEEYTIMEFAKLIRQLVGESITVKNKYRRGIYEGAIDLF